MLMGPDLSSNLFPLNSFFTVFQTSFGSAWGGEAANAAGAHRPGVGAGEHPRH